MADNRQLGPVLLHAETDIFAVLDGAQFDDLPMALFEGDFFHRPLYLDRGTGTADQLRTAPQLVWLDRDRKHPLRDRTEENYPIDESVLDRLFSLVEERPAVVFWQCEGGGERLYRHLRRINKVLIPALANIDRGESYERSPLAQEDDEPKEYEFVIFRHPDSNVMAQVTPSLTPPNISRILGPARQILFYADADWGDKPMRVRHSDDLPSPPSGPLKLSLDEITAMERVRLRAIRRRRVAYLQETCTQETEGVPRERLEEHILISEETGSKLGLVSEAAHCRWAFIVCKTGGRVLKSNEALNFIAHKGKNPDSQVKQFMADAMDWMKAQAQIGRQL